MSEDRPISQPQYELVVEKDIDIPMRDGARLKCDVFRPRAAERFPAILNIGPYQKDKLWIPPSDLEELGNPHFNWETVNPLWWIPRGYASVRIDTRGSGKSLGETDPFSGQEATDFYDAIEWTARQPWCNGNIGLLGISYFAMTQWLVANLQPPSLKAIIPWEGAADMYRDLSFHGGIYCAGFVNNWFMSHQMHHLLGRPYRSNPDVFRKNWLWEHQRNSLDSSWWRARQAQWDRITVPLWSVGNWSGMGLHLRGNTEAYLRAGSEHKKLRIHAGSHFHPFYAEEARTDQIRFFDHWLKGIDNGIMQEPPVKLLIRKGGRGNYEWRFEREWPLARTQWTRYYLHPNDSSPASDNGVEGTLDTSSPAASRSISYAAAPVGPAGVASASWSASAMGDQTRTGVSFETKPFAQPVEVTGPISLTLWCSSDTEDLDIFATIRNIDAKGADVWEIGQQGQAVPVAKGWLRASHRRLDPSLTLPYRPYHRHDERELLSPSEIVRLEVEIWPTCMVFSAGHRLRLDIQPRDGVGSSNYSHYHGDYKTGTNTLHTSPERPCFLLLPIIPVR